MSRGKLEPKLLAMAVAGFSITQIVERDIGAKTHVQLIVKRLLARGALFKGHGYVPFYFDTKAKADAYAAKCRAERKFVPPKERAAPKVAWTGEVIVPAHVKVQQIPHAEDLRFRAAPGYIGELTREWRALTRGAHAL